MPRKETDRTTARRWPLRVVLTLLVLGFAKALHMAIWNRDELYATFPSLTPALEGLMLVSVVLGAVALAGLWFLRRWGLYLLLGAGGLGLVLDVLARGPALHFVASTVLLGLVWILARPLS